MALIGLVGYGQSGKDTFGKLVQLATSNIEFPNWMSIEERMDHIPDRGKKASWEIKKFAGKLKEVATILTGVPIEMWEDNVFKDSMMSNAWGMTNREFLQRLGTEAIRNNLHDNAWVNALMADYIPITAANMIESRWIITDVRFPNEAKVIKSKGGVVVRINKPMVKAVNNHVSESALDDWEFDYIVNNNGDIKELFSKAQVFMEFVMQRRRVS